MRKISVVIPVLIKSNAALAMTMKCIEYAHKNTSLPFELIIVESGSTYLMDECDIHIYENQVTTPEVGHNLGFMVATRSEFVVLLTNDTFVNERWLEVLLNTFKERNDCGLATLGNVRFGHVKEDKIEEGNWFDVTMIKSEVFHKIGYYDERFIGSWPDTDFLVRAYKQGWKMYRNFNCIVDGTEPHATVGLNPRHEENYLMGQRLFQEKHKDCGLPIYDLVK